MKHVSLSLLTLTCIINWCSPCIAMEQEIIEQRMDCVSNKNITIAYLVLREIQENSNVRTYTSLAQTFPNAFVDITTATDNFSYLKNACTALSEQQEKKLVKISQKEKVADLFNLVKSSPYLTALEGYASEFDALEPWRIYYAQRALQRINQSTTPDSTYKAITSVSPVTLVHLSAITRNPSYIQQGVRSDDEKIKNALQQADIPQSVAQWLFEQLYNVTDSFDTHEEDELNVLYFLHRLL